MSDRGPDEDIIYPAMSDFVLSTNIHEPPAHHHPIPVGNEIQFLCDQHLMATGRTYDQYPHGIRWGTGGVEKHPQPIFSGFPEHDNAIAWAQVARQEERYHLWYNSFRDGRLVVAHGVSDDGINFFPVFSAGNHYANAAFTGGPDGVSPEFGNVFIDPNACADQRYKMIYTDWLQPQNKNTPFSHAAGALRGAASPDGQHWKRYYENFLGTYCDSQNVGGWDKHLQRYVIYHRLTCTYGSLDVGQMHVAPDHRGRAIGRIESLDFIHWTPSQIAIAPDEQDGLGIDIYNNAWSPHPRSEYLNLMFPSFYHHHDGTFDVQVAVSRNNINWSRPTRQTLIPLGGETDFDHFIISVCPGIVPIDDEHDALYYRGTNIPHGGSAPVLNHDEIERRKPASRLGRVILKRDRYIGIETTSGHEGRFCTRPMLVDGAELHINCHPIGADAQVSIQIIDASTETPVPGYSFDDAIPVCTDMVRGHVRWRTHTGLNASLRERPIRLHVRMRNMQIFTFQFSD